MKRPPVHLHALFAAALATAAATAHACTSIVVTRGASRDGSVMVTYSADGAFMPRLLRIPGGTHKPGTMIDVKGWEDDEDRGKIPQAERTYSVVGLVNEHQLSLGETTTGGRPELRNRKGQLDYDAHYLLIDDNLLDLSHLSFAHEKTLGLGMPQWADQRPTVTPIENGLRVQRWLRGHAPTGFMKRLGERVGKLRHRLRIRDRPPPAVSG